MARTFAENGPFSQLTAAVYWSAGVPSSNVRTLTRPKSSGAGDSAVRTATSGTFVMSVLLKLTPSVKSKGWLR